MYQYSIFAKWVVLDSTNFNLSVNKDQVNRLIEVNKLSEIVPLKLTKKL
jgi:hypothetical protein